MKNEILSYKILFEIIIKSILKKDLLTLNNFILSFKWNDFWERKSF
jgi:hypothetical protein